MSSRVFKLLIINYSMNLANPVFSHQFDVVAALKRSFPEIMVITREYPSSKNIEIKISRSRWREGKHFVNLCFFYVSLVIALVKFRPKIVFYHMTEVQAALASPILKFLRIRQILWYAHKSNSIWLRIAYIFCDGIVTSTKGSNPLRGNKVHCIGQGIDEKKFKMRVKRRAKTKYIHIGRNDMSKNLLAISEAIISCFSGREVFLDHYGQSLDDKSPDSMNYHSELKALVARNNWITVHPSIKRENIRAVLEKHDVFIHAFQGSLDKILIEAVISGIPVLTVNEEFIKTFGKWDKSYLDVSLQNELKAFIAMSDELIVDICIKRQAEAIRLFGLEAWTAKLTNVLLPPSKI